MTDKPIRIQRKRTKGWRMPPNTVSVCRPGKWGNPFKVGDFAMLYGDDVYIDGNAMAVEVFDHHIDQWPGEQCPTIEEIQTALRGKNLACFCPLDQPCHADVLLEIAND